MEYKDYYKILGVSQDIGDAELKKAYKKLARKYHPDVSKEADAEERFKEVGEAYEVLKDPHKRAQYDQYGSQGGSAGNADFGNFFDSMFGGGGRQQQRPAAGQDIQARLRVTLLEAYEGTSKSIRRPQGSAKAGELTVKIPAGIMQGKKIRVTAQGGAGVAGGPAGDLLLEITISSHPHYRLEGRDIYLDLPITPWEAALGAKVPVPTLAGKINLAIPAGAQSGKKMRLKGRGLPAAVTAGDQFVVLQIHTPPADNDASTQFYEKMATALPLDPRTALHDI